MNKKTYNFEDRLVEFAAAVILFCKTLPKDRTGYYYGDQIMRSSGSSALHYGEAQGTTTAKDFIHKMSVVLKELKETRVSLKILDRVNYGDDGQRKWLLNESSELASISAKMILNKQNENEN
ncbi:MAG TPA: four helix bundle protein [Bacteroidetes bacterium]|nr:four helix bundle protein [Bacteroidota bacterium]